MNSNLGDFSNFQLGREQLKSVMGGYGSCTASCNDGSVVTCSGTNCNANDGSGCSSSEETHPCPSGSPNN